MSVTLLRRLSIRFCSVTVGIFRHSFRTEPVGSGTDVESEGLVKGVSWGLGHFKKFHKITYYKGVTPCLNPLTCSEQPVLSETFVKLMHGWVLDFIHDRQRV